MCSIKVVDGFWIFAKIWFAGKHCHLREMINFWAIHWATPAPVKVLQGGNFSNENSIWCKVTAERTNSTVTRQSQGWFIHTHAPPKCSIGTGPRTEYSLTPAICTLQLFEIAIKFGRTTQNSKVNFRVRPQSHPRAQMFTAPPIRSFKPFYPQLPRLTI